MKNKTIIVLLITIFIFSAIAFAEDVNIVILHTNDIHGHVLPHVNKKIEPDGSNIAGLAYMAAVIEKLRIQYPGHALLLDAGDMFQGDPISNIFHGKVIVDVMNELKYDAAALGNHEFDWGQDVLLKRIKEMRFPVLSANIIRKNNQLVFNEVRPYIIKEIDGIKFGILGLTTETTPCITMPSNVKGLIFEDPAEVFNKYYPVLKSKGADIIIVLSHLGLDEDKKLASKVRGIDIIVGGHQHIPVNKPVYNKKHHTIITQAGCYGEYLGRIVLCIDKVNKKIKSFTEDNELILIKPSELVPVKKIDQIIARYENLIKNKMEEVLAENKKDMINQKYGKEDTAIGNFICDIMKSEASADISFQNAGGIRESFYKGPIKMKDVYACLPFDNTIVTMDLTGEQIYNLLNSTFKEGRRGIYFSGLQIVYNPKNKEKPVEEIYVVYEKNAGTGRDLPLQPINPDKIYKVATNNFLAEGGDAYSEFKEGKNLTQGKVLRDVVMDYMRKQKIIDYKFTTRIKIK